MADTAKFKVAMVKDGNPIVKLSVDSDDNDGTWFTTSSAVVNFAKKSFKEDEEVKVTYNENDGTKFVTRIEKLKGGNSRPSNTNKTPVKKSSWSNKSDNYRTPEQITTDEIGHMTAKSLICLQGHIDPNNICDIITQIYETYKKMIKG